MQHIKSITSGLFILLLFGFCQAVAQSLIAGIPSADVAEYRHIELTHESQLGAFNQPFKWNSFNILCYGLNRRTELTATFNNVNNSGSINFSPGIGVKHMVPLFDGVFPAWEGKLVLGGAYMFGLNQRSHGGWGYALGSFRLPAAKSRVTGGITYGTEQVFGFRSAGLFSSTSEIPNRTWAAMAGFEQPVAKNFSVIADWISGNHDIGALIVAGQYDWGHNVFILGYKLPNPNTGQVRAIIVEFMLALGHPKHRSPLPAH